MYFISDCHIGCCP